MSTTMKDIARLCGLSVGSVSQVIRNPENPRFTPATRKLILDTAKALDYHQNPLSCALRTNKTHLIGLVLPWNEPEVMDSIESLVNENGYKMLLQFTAHPREGMELVALRSLMDWNADGILWEPSGQPNPGVTELLRQVKREHCPVVLLKQAFEGVELPLVGIDYEAAIWACVAHLKEQGYERIMFITYESGNGIQKLKYDYLRNACWHYEIPLLREELSYHVDAQYSMLNKLYETEYKRGTAYICLSWLALCLLEVMESKGLQAPQDYGLVLLQDMLLGGNFRVSTFFRPQLTSIWVDCQTLARRAVRVLLDEMGAKGASDCPVLSEPAFFTVRKSTLRH